MTDHRIAVDDFVLCERAPGEPLLLGHVNWVGESIILVTTDYPRQRQVVPRDHVLAAGTVAELAAFQRDRLAADSRVTP